MSDTPTATPPQPAPRGPAVPSDLRLPVIVCYFLFLIACINGLTAFIGVMIAHSGRRCAAGTIWQSHFENLILVFWVFVAVLLIAIASRPPGLWPNFHFFPPAAPNGHSGLAAVASTLPLIFGFVGFPILVLWYLPDNQGHCSRLQIAPLPG